MKGSDVASASCPQERGNVEITGRLWCLAGIAQDAPDGWTRLNPSARELVRQSAVELDRLTKVADAGMGVIASLAAAISLLERTPRAKKAAASDRMFNLMLDDYRKALDRARAMLSAPSALENSPAGLADAHSKDPSRTAMPKEEDTHG